MISVQNITQTDYIDRIISWKEKYLHVKFYCPECEPFVILLPDEC